MTSRLPGSPNRNGGFTMVELMFTVAITGLVTALAVPNFRDFIQNNRAAEEANALVGALQVARSEAVTRGIRVSVCSSRNGATCSGLDDWTTGWIVFTDANALMGDVTAVAAPAISDTVLRVMPALRVGSVLAADADFVSYAANGFLAPGTGSATFDLDIAECTGDHNRQITVNLQGRAAVVDVACD